MPYVEVFYSIVKESRNKDVARALNWYDVKKHRMYSFTASKLDFKYKYDDELEEYRMLPEPVNEMQKYNVNMIDRGSVETWFDSYLNYNNTASSLVSKGANGVTFFVNEKELDDFVYSLERNNFRFSIME